MLHLFVGIFVFFNTVKKGPFGAIPQHNLQTPTEYSAAKTISAADLKQYLQVLASDEFEGRATGEIGQQLAATYIADAFAKFGMKGLEKKSSFIQTYPIRYADKFGQNVVGAIEGTSKKDEYIIISAHYDHLGIKDGVIYNGADDNGSGTACLIELAKVFAKAKADGMSIKRSILFIAFSGEELGLLGSQYYTENPLVPFDNTVADLNMDMMGRRDTAHADAVDYIYVIGADKLSKELDQIANAANDNYCQLRMDYTYNSEKDPNHYYYRSDHYNFVKQGIPVIFYFNGVHADYHQPSDKEDKIDYQLMEKRAQLVFHTAMELANRSERIKLDVKQKKRHKHKHNTQNQD